jgi:hypothetical protein
MPSSIQCRRQELSGCCTGIAEAFEPRFQRMSSTFFNINSSSEIVVSLSERQFTQQVAELNNFPMVIAGNQ